MEECEANIKMCRRIDEQLIDAYGLCRMERCGGTERCGSCKQHDGCFIINKNYFNVKGEEMKKRGLVLSVTAIAVAAGLMAGCTNKQGGRHGADRGCCRYSLIRTRRQGSASKN